MGGNSKLFNVKFSPYTFNFYRWSDFEDDVKRMSRKNGGGNYLCMYIFCFVILPQK